MNKHMHTQGKKECSCNTKVLQIQKLNNAM